MKKLFFTMFIRCGIQISYFILLPFVDCFFEQGSENFIFALQMLEYVNIVLSIVLIEYTGKKFQNLRRELPTGYTLYLSVVFLFANMAVLSGYDVVIVRNAGIKVSIDMAIPAQGYVKPIDLCCILSNAFDNAIAACKHLAEVERWITARAFVKQGQFIIEIKNSKPDHVTVIGGEVFPKEITADHGIGLDSVKSVVEQYSGTLNVAADNVFSFRVLLPPNLL